MSVWYSCALVLWLVLIVMRCSWMVCAFLCVSERLWTCIHVMCVYLIHFAFGHRMHTLHALRTVLEFLYIISFWARIPLNVSMNTISIKWNFSSLDCVYLIFHEKRGARMQSVREKRWIHSTYYVSQFKIVFFLDQFCVLIKICDCRALATMSQSTNIFAQLYWIEPTNGVLKYNKT